MYYSLYNHNLCYREYLKEVIKTRKRKQLMGALLILLSLKAEKRKRKSSKKRFWVNTLLQERKQLGFYYRLFPIIRNCTLRNSSFFNYFRMTPSQFENLLTIVGPKIKKQSLYREAISEAERLSLTLR